jgi:hypothetical protein
LDDVKSPSTSSLVLIYASGGGGKTFYRRWAARQIEEYESLQGALEISNLGEHIDISEGLTARDLAQCVYEQISQKFLGQVPEPAGHHVARIFAQCDEVLRYSPPDTQGSVRLHAYIDDVGQLFDEQLSSAERNVLALKAIVGFCKAAAQRSGGEPLALRMFIPIQLKEHVQRGLGNRLRSRITEATMFWRTEHCQAIIERRLDSYWMGGSNTGIVHLSRLLAQDALDEFLRWLHRQESMSPRCVIRVFDELGKYAYGQGMNTELIEAKLWNRFLSENPTDVLCVPDSPYPLRPLPRFRRWLKVAALLVLLLILTLAGLWVWGDPEAVILGMAQLVRSVLAWLADASDLIGAIVLLSLLLGGAFFAFWCLIQGARTDRGVSLRLCFQRIWYLLRRHIPGAS